MPFFVWTADNSVRHQDGPGSGCIDKREHFFRNAGIVADIGSFREPASNVRGVDIRSRHDADSELGGSGVVWTVERDGRDGVAAKSFLGSFAQSLACTSNHVPVVARPGAFVKSRIRSILENLRATVEA
jgi:hypothetical protein